MYGYGVSEVNIIYRSGKTNANADSLSRNPCLPALLEDVGESEVQVAAVSSEPYISFGSLLQAGMGLRGTHLLLSAKNRRMPR